MVAPVVRPALEVIDAADATDARFALDELAGRLVELRGAATLTAAFGLVRAAQGRGEPTAYVMGPAASFYPIDVAEGGVDLEAIAVIRVEAVAARARAADELVRSGAFALVVIDLACADEARAAAVPPALLSRLLGLAQKHRTAIVFLTGGAATSADAPSQLGSLVSLRAIVRRGPFGASRARFAVEVEAVKDKRRAPGWRVGEICRGPKGLG